MNSRESKVRMNRTRHGTPSPRNSGETSLPRGPRRALLRKDSAELADERCAVLAKSKSTEPPWRSAHLRWRPPAQTPSTAFFAPPPAPPSTSFVAPSLRSCTEHPHDPRLLIWPGIVDLTGDANPKHGAHVPLGECKPGGSHAPVLPRSSAPPRISPADCPNAVFAGTGPALEVDESIPQITTPATPRRRIHAQPARRRDTPVPSPLPGRSAGRPRCAIPTATTEPAKWPANHPKSGKQILFLEGSAPHEQNTHKGK